jgi:CheY-like chemotaxis protein
MVGLEALKDILVLRGHYADTAESGSEALEKIGSAFGLRYCPVRFGNELEMNGWEVAHIVLQTNPNRNFYIWNGTIQTTGGKEPYHFDQDVK